MVDFDDDELFEGLESDSEPQSDFDVASVLRRVKKLEYKLEKQKAYKKDVELKLKLGVEKTEEAIESLKDMVLKYMQANKKTKLTFDDVGTISVVNADKEDWIFPADKEGEAELLRQVIAEFSDDPDLLKKVTKTDVKVDKKGLKEYLEGEPEMMQNLKAVKWDKVDPHLTFRKK